jgi:hypothetical protein
VDLRVIKKRLYTRGAIPRWARLTIRNHAEELIEAITTKQDVRLRVITGCEFFGPQIVVMSRGYKGPAPLELATRMTLLTWNEHNLRERDVPVPDQIKRMNTGNLKWIQFR